MNRVVLDASAILAAILQEPGTRMVMEQLPHAVVSSVNMAEVKGELIGRASLRPMRGEWLSATRAR